jgi:dihydrofolate reductase
VSLSTPESDPKVGLVVVVAEPDQSTSIEFTPKFTELQRKQLDEQLRNHVQLLSQTCLATYNISNFQNVFEEAFNLLKVLESLNKKPAASTESENDQIQLLASNFEIINLAESLEIMEKVKQEPANVDSSAALNLDFNLNQGMPIKYLEIILNSPVFYNTNLIPSCKYKYHSHFKRFSLSDTEKILLIVGYNKFKHLPKDQCSKCIHEHLLSNRSCVEIKKHLSLFSNSEERQANLKELLSNQKRLETQLVKNFDFCKSRNYKSPFDQSDSVQLPSMYTIIIERIRMATILKETKKHLNEQNEKKTILMLSKPVVDAAASPPVVKIKKKHTVKRKPKATPPAIKLKNITQNSTTEPADLTETPPSPDCANSVITETSTDSEDPNTNTTTTNENNAALLNSLKRRRLLKLPYHDSSSQYRHVSPPKTNSPVDSNPRKQKPKITCTKKGIAAAMSSTEDETPLGPARKNTNSVSEPVYGPSYTDFNETCLEPPPPAAASKPATTLTTLSKNQQIFVQNTPNFFLSSQFANAFQVFSSASSSSSNMPYQAFAFQPQIIQPTTSHNIAQNTTPRPIQQQQQQQQQMPFILPSSFNGTILYQPTIYLNTNDIIRTKQQKSMERYRQIVPKKPSASNEANK